MTVPANRLILAVAVPLVALLCGGCPMAEPPSAEKDGAAASSLRIDLITPNQGPAAGGTRLTIRGGPFQDNVAAWVAVHVLAGQSAPALWGLAAGVSLQEVRLETEEPVDDVFVRTSGGGVCDSRVRFHIASSASNNPARSPTRGSGVGGPNISASAPAIYAGSVAPCGAGSAPGEPP